MDTKVLHDKRLQVIMVTLEVSKTRSSQNYVRLRNNCQLTSWPASSSRHIARPQQVSLGLHLKGDTNFVSPRIDIAAVDEGREGDGDSIPQFLLVSKPNLTLVVNLSTHSCSIRENIFCPNSKSGRGGGRAPSKGN